MDVTEQLHRAIHAGLLKEVKRLVEEGARMDRVLGMRGTALCAAIEARNLEITNYLLDAGCDVNAEDFDGEPPLLLALRKDSPGHIKDRIPSLEIAFCLIQNKKCKVNKVDKLTKKCAIHFATEQGMAKVVLWLMGAPGSCNINAVDANGNTPLHLAMAQGHHDVVEVLVSSPECWVKVYNKAGLTPMHICSNNGDVKSLKILLERLNSGKLVLRSEAEDKGGFESELSINVNAVSLFEKETCLHLAVRNEYVDVVKILLESEARVNETNLLDNSALQLSVVSVKHWQQRCNQIPRMLLKGGANPNVKSTVRCRYVSRDIEFTPLILAAINNNVELARLLVDNGADINMTDTLGRTPVYVALWESCKSVAHYFLRECPTINVNLKTEEGCTCMHAVMKCHDFKNATAIVEMIRSILQAGGKFMKNKLGKTPFDCALEYENHDALNCFLEETDALKSDLNHNLTCLCFTICDGLIDIMKVLLAHGADINKCVNLDESHLYIALYNSEYRIAEFLVNNGCDLTNEGYIFRTFENKTKKYQNVVDSDDDDDDDDYESSDDDSDYSDNSQDLENFDVFRRNEKLREWVRSVATSPRTLELTCLLEVRRYFKDKNIPFRKIEFLPIPDKMKNKLRYREV